MRYPIFHRGLQICFRAYIVLAPAAAFSLSAHAQQEKTLAAVDVIGTTPLPGIGQPRIEIAAPVQSARSRDVERSGALELGDFMNRTLGSCTSTRYKAIHSRWM